MHSCEYYSILITVFSSQLSITNGSPQALAIDQSMTAQDVIAQAAMQLESILRMYYLRHSFEAYDLMLTVFLVHLANLTFTAVEQLEQGSLNVSTEASESLLSTLILCFKGLYDQSKNAYVASLVLAVMKKRSSTEVLHAITRYVTPEEADTPELEATNEPTAEHLPPILSDFVLPGASLSEDPKRWKLANMASELRRG
jgi:hypothetical protein